MLLMPSTAMDDFIDDCFIGKDPICDLHREDSLWLDGYVSKLISETSKLIEETPSNSKF